MDKKEDFDKLLFIDKIEYLRGIDIPSLCRHEFIIRRLLDLGPIKILEIGSGDGIVKHCASQFAEEYMVMDINDKLQPDVVADVRVFNESLEGRFDAVICTEVLEHMPYQDLKTNLNNINRYLRPGGQALISLPHRRGRVLLATPLSYKKPWIIDLPAWLKSSPKSFYQQVVKKITWKDPAHYWEIDDRNIKIAEVETQIRECGFDCGRVVKILGADCWQMVKN